MEERKHSVKEWLSYAYDDFFSAKLLADNGVHRTALYHTQQAAEKYLKAFIISKGQFPPKTHDLTLLVTICFDYDKDFFALFKQCAFLNQFATKTRYPDDYSIPDDEDMKRALAAVTVVKDCIEKKLNFPQ